jgi:hypothetical protein
VLHKVNGKGEVLLYKEMRVGSCSMTLDTKYSSFSFLENVPVAIRVGLSIEEI